MIAPKHFVLIRGLLREARHWGIFTEYLQQQFPSSPTPISQVMAGTIN